MAVSGHFKTKIELIFATKIRQQNMFPLDLKPETGYIIHIVLSYYSRLKLSNVPVFNAPP